MPTILAIETATNACSVALQHGDAIVERYQVGNSLHSQLLLNMIAEVLSECELSTSNLESVAVGQGPGSFTGLRIGVGVAQGIAYGAECKMIGVSSLAALAWQAINQGQGIKSGASVLTGIDARMKEIYCAEYLNINGFPELHGEIAVLPPEKVIGKSEAVLLAGNAWEVYWLQLNDQLRESSLPEDDVIYPRAKGILALAQIKYSRGGALIDPLEFEPDYIRDDVAKKSVKLK